MKPSAVMSGSPPRTTATSLLVRPCHGRIPLPSARRRTWRDDAPPTERKASPAAARDTRRDDPPRERITSVTPGCRGLSVSAMPAGSAHDWARYASNACASSRTRGSGSRDDSERGSGPPAESPAGALVPRIDNERDRDRDACPPCAQCRPAARTSPRRAHENGALARPALGCRARRRGATKFGLRSMSRSYMRERFCPPLEHVLESPGADRAPRPSLEPHLWHGGPWMTRSTAEGLAAARSRAGRSVDAPSKSLWSRNLGPQRPSPRAPRCP